MANYLSYWLDHQNIIQQVDDTWDSNMDSETWADRAASKTIIGHPLFEFICDDVTRMYVASIIDSVRILPQTLFRPYRCDTPSLKRFMQMIVTPETNGWIRVSHRLLKSEPNQAKLRFKTTLLDTAQAKDQHLIWHCADYVRCSMCNRIRNWYVDDWQDADGLSVQSEGALTVKVLYGVCPECMNTLKE